MLAACLERAGPAGRAQPRRLEHGLGRGHGAARRRARAAASSGLFEVDEAWLPSVAEQVDPRLLLLSNLFRDQLDRYGELELLADRWAELVERLDGSARFVLNADDPLVADLGRGRAGGDLLRRRGRLAGAARHAARRRLQALPQLRPRLRLRGDLPRPPGPLPLPQLRPRAAGAAGRRHARDARRDDAARGSSCARRRARSSVRLPLPGLYNVYNAVAAAATALELGVPLATVGEALEGFGGAFGRVETIPIDGPPGLDPAGQEPGRRQRGAAHAHARGRRGSTSGWP